MNTNDFSNTELKIIEYIKNVKTFTRKDVCKKFPDFKPAYFFNFLTKCEAHGILLYESGKGTNMVYNYLKEL